MRNSRGNIKVRGGGGEVSPWQRRYYPAALRRDHGGAGISLQLVERTMPDQMSTLQPVENLMLEQMDMPEGIVAHTEPMLEQGKNMRRKDKQREPSTY